MSEPIKFWNLKSPKMCRDFIKSLWIQRPGRDPFQITEVTLECGRTILLDEASDEQILQLANELALMINPGSTKQ